MKGKTVEFLTVIFYFFFLKQCDTWTFFCSVAKKHRWLALTYHHFRAVISQLLSWRKQILTGSSKMAIVCDRTSLLHSCSHAWGSVPRRGYMSWSVSQGWLPKITSSVNCVVNCICKSLMLENLHLLLAWSDFSSKGQEQLSWQHRGAGGEGFLTTAVPHRRDAGMFAAGYSAWVLNLTPSSCEGKPPRVSLWVPTALPKGHDGAARTSEREMGTMQPAPGAELQMPMRRTHGKFSIQT